MRTQMVHQRHKVVVVDLLLVLMVLVVLVYLLLVLVVLITLVVVQTKKQTDTMHLTLMVKALVLAQQSGLKNHQTQTQYIFKVVEWHTPLEGGRCMVVVVLDITEVVVHLTQAVILEVLVVVLEMALVLGVVLAMVMEMAV